MDKPGYELESFYDVAEVVRKFYLDNDVSLPKKMELFDLLIMQLQSYKKAEQKRMELLIDI